MIEKAAEAAQWSSWKRPEGRGHGIAYARIQEHRRLLRGRRGSRSSRHELRCTRIVAAADVGLIVNPDGVANQLEGGCIQAASWTLKEDVEAERHGRAGRTIRSCASAKCRKVEVHLLNNKHPSLGAGECTMGPVAAAIANALHDALGVRARELPLTPERIAAAINAKE